MLTECTRSDICLEGRGSDMPAQGIALGIGSGVENSNALKGRTGLWSRILFRPFRAGRILIRIGSPGPTPQAGFPPPGLFCFGPYGAAEKRNIKIRKGGKTAQRNRHERPACSRPTLHRAGVGPGVFTDRVECRSPQAHNELASRRENDGEAVFPPSSSGRLPLPAESGCPDSRPLRSHRLKPT